MPLSTDEATMLLAFRVSNFKSIRDEAELLLTRSKRLAPPEDLGEPVAGYHPNPVTAIYGANASGKSNVLAGIAFLSMAVRDSFSDWEPGRSVPVTPFLLDEESAGQPTMFEADFVLEGVRYLYGFEVDRERVLGEWLHAYPHRRRQVWFERTTGEKEPFYFGGYLGGQNKAVADLTRENALFLSTAFSAKHQQLTPLARWLAGSIRFAHSRNEQGRVVHTSQAVREDPTVKQRVLRLLRAADLGIGDIEVLAEEMPEEQRERLMRALRELVGEEELEDRGFESALDQEFLSLSLQHLAGEGRLVGLPFEVESQGTRALFALAGPALDALRLAHVLLVDEIEISLHPDLLREIVRLFQSPASNPKGAQLVFTGHETTLLDTVTGDKALLDRDQVWLTDKDERGRTHLTPVSDFKLRKEENLRRQYLQGRLGGVPLLDPEDFRDVGEWGDVDTEKPGTKEPDEAEPEAPATEALSDRR